MNIKLTIDRVEEDRAVLMDDDGNQIVWPLDKLPKGSNTEGSVLNFNVMSDEDTEKDKRILAKEILNEILNAE